MDEQRWWRIKVYEPESRTYTWLDRFGLLDEIEQDLTEEGLWVFVRGEPSNYD